jgi:hypothetical protein
MAMATRLTFPAPGQLGSSRRTKSGSLGPGGIESRLGSARQGFAPKLDGWLTVIEGRGPDAVQRVYRDTLGGRIPPDQGHMLSMMV